MFTNLPLFPEAASEHARHVDAIYLFITLVTIGVSLLIAGAILYFSIKYRRRPGTPLPPPIKGSVRLEIAWSLAPFVVGMVMFFWGAKIYFTFAEAPREGLHVNVIGKQWMWKLQHPQGQREINELHVPAGVPIVLNMTSEDVIHSFYVPALRIKQDVVPGRYSQIWFRADKPGKHHLFCAEYCGAYHSRMTGWLIVQEPAEYQNWLGSRAEGSAALEGRKLFLKLQCISCHNSESNARGPRLENIFAKQITLADGKQVIADENYLRESIVQPRAKIVAGYEAIMPTFQGQVDEEELLQLIAYMRSLDTGEIPNRVENAPPPEQKPSQEKKRE